MIYFIHRILHQSQPLEGKLLSTTYQPIVFIPYLINEKSRTIYDCFDEYTKNEKLTGDNKWLNEETGEFIEVYKKISFWKLPKF